MVSRVTVVTGGSSLEQLWCRAVVLVVHSRSCTPAFAADAAPCQGNDKRSIFIRFTAESKSVPSHMLCFKTSFCK